MMTLDEILQRCQALGVYEKREINDKYAELVFYTRDTPQWTDILTDTLGPAVKPEGIKADRDQLLLTEGYGGIQRNQTLFNKAYGPTSVMAMFWPWQDGIHTTLKLALSDSI